MGHAGGRDGREKSSRQLLKRVCMVADKYSKYATAELQCSEKDSSPRGVGIIKKAAKEEVRDRKDGHHRHVRQL